ncbi:MAG: hypothetical protein LC620_08985 [Halobacteriales archaeon]|nr:hypothetical protein [Halobacteriales archaeon]
MDSAQIRPAPMIVGGLFLGLWLYPDFFRIPVFGALHLGLWNFWGFLGIAVAGGFYGSKVANAQVRVIIWVVMGIAIGFMVMAATFNQVGEAFAALFTVVGAGLIVTGLPGGWTTGGPQGMQGPWQDADPNAPNAPRQ